MLTNSLGHVIVNIVDGTTFTGARNDDGSVNVFDASGITTPVGVQHPCGAMYVFPVDGTDLTGRYAPNGSIYVVVDSTEYGIYHPCGAMNITGYSVPNAKSFLATYGPYGMVMDFTDASIEINDEADVLDYSSIGQVSEGLLAGPGAKLTYSAPSPKLTEQADGNLAFQAHNLYLNSAAPANQSITVLSGASYAITITGTVSVTASGAATGTWTAGTTTFTAATGTLTLGSTSGSGTVHLRRTPSVSTYIATTTAAAYDLPYVYSSGVMTGIMVEPAATNYIFASQDPSSGSWTSTNLTHTQGAITGPDGRASGWKMQVTTTSGTALLQGRAVTGTSATAYVIVKKGGSATDLNRFLLRDATTATALVGITIDYNTLGITYTVGASGASITELNDGWLLIALTAGITSGNIIQFYIGSPGGTETAGEYIYFWHAQLEAGPVATSPIITYGSAVLRAVDTLTQPANTFPSTFPLTISAVFRSYTANNNNAVYGVMSIDDGTIANRAALYKYNAAAGYLIASAGVQQATQNIPAGLTPAGEEVWLSLRTKLNDVRPVLDGVLATLDTSATMPGSVSLLRVGQWISGGFPLNGLLVRLIIVPRDVTDAELPTFGAPL